MTTMAATELDTAAIHAAIDFFCDRELDGDRQLKPEDVVSIVHDVCIDARCRTSGLPSALIGIYEDARQRCTRADYGHVNFITQNLIDQMERALKVVS